MNREELERQALDLPAIDRAQLAQALLASFDGFPALGVDELWLEEAERRLRELDREG